jgi:predicted O-methyltransferase YrrM
MYSSLKLFAKYINYKWHASNAKGHAVHSPFVYDFIRNVLLDQRHFYSYEAIESCRKETLKDSLALQLPKKIDQLIFRIVNYYAPENILELGTSLGITTSYLASAKENIRVVTMEQSSDIAAIAKSNFEKIKLKNIEIIVGDFEDSVSEFLATEKDLDFVFVKGIQQKAQMLHFFKKLLLKVHEKSIVIFERIHSSVEMEESWNEIQQLPQVRLTIDLFFIGLVFFRKENKIKQHFSINF